MTDHTPAPARLSREEADKLLGNLVRLAACQKADEDYAKVLAHLRKLEDENEELRAELKLLQDAYHTPDIDCLGGRI